MHEIRQQMARGDHSGFSALIREHQSFVYSLAYRFFGDRGAAEDIAQDVFLDLYRNLDAIEDRGHLKPWLRRVTSHRCIDEARRRKVRPLFCVEELPEVPIDGYAGDPLLDETLRAGVRALPENQRMVVLLRYQDDLDPSEISETLGMPVNTVKSHLHRALAALRSKVTRRVEGVRA